MDGYSLKTFLGKIWEDYVDTLKRANSEKDALKDSRSWTTYHHIEMLSMIFKMKPVVRSLLHKLRKKRNRIVHEKEWTTQDESY
jgi:hypothetical protein